MLSGNFKIHILSILNKLTEFKLKKIFFMLKIKSINTSKINIFVKLKINYIIFV